MSNEDLNGQAHQKLFSDKTTFSGRAQYPRAPLDIPLGRYHSPHLHRSLDTLLRVYEEKGHACMGKVET